MSPIYVPGKVVLRKELPADAEADAYIAAVEAADGQALEPGVKFAIKNFVLCCKDDGIWDAIKASCILAGARTLAGALVPLTGAAPSNVGPFVSGDYNRKTGLVGDGSTKYLDSNRNNNADPQDSNHNAVYATSLVAPSQLLAVGTIGNNANNISTGGTRNRSSTFTSASPQAGFIGVSRSSSASYSYKDSNGAVSIAVSSSTPFSGNLFVFARNLGGSIDSYSASRLAFYSIGESLDLALLDARVTDLINAFAAAIP
jgi:hypothetical protein